MKKYQLELFIKQQAKSLGFDACGIAAAGFLTDEQQFLEQWLNEGMNADMAYMARNVDKRLDVRLLVPKAKSVVCLLMSYKPQAEQPKEVPQVACYAYGNDYHDIVREKLNTLLAMLKQQQPQCEGRGFVDSAPVLERAWAVKAGFGWIGKSGMLLSEEFGSYTFLAELVVNVELEYDSPYQKNLCGSCTKCIDACPVNAIVKPCTVDARKCISYQTIEHKGELSGSLHGWLFGCDICQQVCPWNKKARIVNHSELTLNDKLLAMDKDAWNSISEDSFDQMLKGSPLKRTGFGGIKRNLNSL